MRKDMVWLVLMMLFFAVNLEADEGESGIPSLMLDSYGAREMALGDTFVGIADDVNTLSVNPAGLNTLESMEGSIMYLKYPLDMSFSHVALGIPLPESAYNGVVGISITLFSLADFDQYDSVGNKDEVSLSASDFVISLGYANNPLKLLGMTQNLSIGLGFKYIRSKLVDDSQSAVGMDIGALYKMDFISWGSEELKDNLGIGVSIQNPGSSVSYGKEDTPLPRNLRMGMGYTGYKDHWHSLLLGFDVNIANDSGLIMSVGLEYSFMEMILGRIGYKLSGREVDSLSFGIGGKYTLSGKNLGFDYALIPLTDLGTMHSFSLGVKF